MNQTSSNQNNSRSDGPADKKARIFKNADKRQVYKDSTVVDTYDRRLYFGLSGGLFYKKEMACIDDWFPQRGRILDAPCGTGKLGRFLKDRGDLELYGLDISPLMVETASKTGAYRKLEVGDISNLTYQDEFFDIVYVSRFFMLFQDITPFLCEFDRVLRPNGLLIFDNIRRSIHNLINATIGTAEGWNYPRKTKLMRKIVQENGFQILDHRSEFLLSTGIMNRMPPMIFKLASAIQQIFPEPCRVMEFYKTAKIISNTDNPLEQTPSPASLDETRDSYRS